MNLFVKCIIGAALLFASGGTPSFADRLILLGDRPVEGTILATNSEGFILTTEYGTQVYPKDIVKSAEIDQEKRALRAKKARFPDAHTIVAALKAAKWADHPKQIPATVIDQGILRNIPYVSYRIGQNYEINIYGDLEHPAGVEAGVYRELLNDDSAKENCVQLIFNLLSQDSDKAAVFQLKRQTGIITNSGLAFEITPPTAKDAYGGWWISVYSEAELDRARASDDEMSTIAVAKSSASTNHAAGWTAADLKLARPDSPYPSTVSFVDESGHFMKDAKVVSVQEGVSLIWRDGASGGVLKLARLPEDLRKLFRYDPAKAAAADERERLKKQQEADAAAAAQRAAVATASGYEDYSTDATAGYAAGGRVYVRGYTRANGTYVAPYSRSSPHSRH